MNKQDEKRVREIVREELQKHLDEEFKIAMITRRLLGFGKPKPKYNNAKVKY